MPLQSIYEGSLRDHFSTEFAIVQPGVPILYPGVKDDPPNEAPWVRFNILPARTEQADFANNKRWTTAGIIVIEIYVDQDSGEGTATEIGDKIVKIMQGKSIGTVLVRGGSPTKISNEAWFQLNLNFDYEVDTFDSEIALA